MLKHSPPKLPSCLQVYPCILPSLLFWRVNFPMLLVPYFFPTPEHRFCNCLSLPWFIYVPFLLEIHVHLFMILQFRLGSGGQFLLCVHLWVHSCGCSHLAGHLELRSSMTKLLCLVVSSDSWPGCLSSLPHGLSSRMAPISSKTVEHSKREWAETERHLKTLLRSHTSLSLHCSAQRKLQSQSRLKERRRDSISC